MNIIVLLIVTILYFLIAGVFGYFYWKNEYNLAKTIKAIKKEFKKRCIFCINKEAIAKEVGMEKSVELEELLSDTLDSNNGVSCKEPVPGLNLNLCLQDPLSADEIKIREKVLKILNKKKQIVFDGGKEKLVVPMEAVLFLTKEYNPLVSEDGDIILNIKKEKASSSELVNELTNRMKSGDLLSSEDKDLLDSLEKFGDIINKTKKSTNSEPEINDSTKKENIVKENPDEIEAAIVTRTPIPEKDITPFKKEEVKQDESKSEEKAYLLKVDKDVPLFLKEQDEPKEKPIEKSDKPAPLKLDLEKPPVLENNEDTNDESTFLDIGAPSQNSNPYRDDEDDEEIEDDDEDDMGIDMDQVLEGAISEIDEMGDFEDLEEDEENQMDFYQKLEYKSKKGAFLDFNQIRDSLRNLFSDSESLFCFFNNLAKTTPLVFNPSKTVVLADLNNIYFAISKMCGIEFVNYAESFSNSRKQTNEIIEVLNEIFEHFLSDMISDTKGISFYLVKEKGSKNSFVSRGAVFKVDSFLNGLSHGDLDYFRSSPHESKYTVVKKASKEDSKGSTPLVTNLKEVEII